MLARSVSSLQGVIMKFEVKEQERLRQLCAQTDKPIKVNFENGKAAGWLCAICRRFWADKHGLEEARKNAMACCRPTECLHGLTPYNSYCWRCSRDREAKHQQAVFEAAEKVKLEDLDESVLAHGVFAPNGDEIMHDPELLTDLDPVPEYCWPAKAVRFRLDPERAADLLMDWGDSVDWDNRPPELVDEDELKEFLRRWNEKQTALFLEPDYEKAILLPEEWLTK